MKGVFAHLHLNQDYFQPLAPSESFSRDFPHFFSLSQVGFLSVLYVSESRSLRTQNEVAVVHGSQTPQVKSTEHNPAIPVNRN